MAEAEPDGGVGESAKSELVADAPKETAGAEEEEAAGARLAAGLSESTWLELKGVPAVMFVAVADEVGVPVAVALAVIDDVELLVVSDEGEAVKVAKTMGGLFMVVTDTHTAEAAA